MVCFELFIKLHLHQTVRFECQYSHFCNLNITALESVHHLQQFCVNIRQLVVGQYETGDVLIVLFHRIQCSPAGPAQIVVGQIQNRGPVGDGGEVSEA